MTSVHLSRDWVVQSVPFVPKWVVLHDVLHFNNWISRFYCFQALSNMINHCYVQQL